MTAVQGAPLFSVLQSGDGVPADATYVPADPAQVLWGRLPRRGDVPVATVEPGATVVVDTISHEGLLDDQGSDPVAYFGGHGVARDQVLADAVEVVARRTREPGAGPHVVTGPIAVDGARPGDLLAIRVDNLALRAPYGVISTRHGRGMLAGTPYDGSYGQFCTVTEDGRFGTMPIAPGSPHLARFPLAPFLGIMGVATDTAERVHSVPPGRHGGNIDVKLLTAGATLFLPVQVPDALFYVGDPHFAQGDGEVALTALEAPLRATLHLDVIPAEQVADVGIGPFAAGHGLVIPTGLDPDLNVALSTCVGNAVDLLGALFETDPRSAYLYLSAATDFTISQAVDLTRGVHGKIRVSDFAHTSGSALARYVLGRAG
ncbi:acetamidase/formamidase family protein [Nocardia camponoti]|uniref:Formamidase n=1 Tax=Nocardia camponoti TaxID=1616106 RepID=A0A917QAQ2_9NOCA|nr:acetamidase/formamidase family protein [Nocardia camponoti]GGK40128.1 formamidase [Nocardia camponoti]